MPTESMTKEELQDLAASYIEEWIARGKSKHQAFSNWGLERVLGEHSPSPEQIEEATSLDYSGDRGVDGWFLGVSDDGTTELHVTQSKDTGLDEEDVAKTVNNFHSLFPATSENTAFKRANRDVGDRVTEFHNRYLVDPDSNLRIVFTIYTSEFAPESAKTRARELSQIPTKLTLSSGQVREIESRVEVLDIRDLVDSLDETGEPIPFGVIVAQDRFMENRSTFPSATVVVDGQEISDLYASHGIKLFRQNPRYYQSKSTAVNKEIYATLQDDEGRKNFYIYNNGLTAICDTLVVSRLSGDPTKFDSDVQVKLDCDNFQIVNGCQTTVTLHEAHRSGQGLRNVKVQLKVIESPGPIAPQIARYTNSQNKLKAEDYRTNEPIHKRLQDELKILKEIDPWFYEFKSGEWRTDYSRASDKQKFTEGVDRYGVRKFGLKELAQSCLSFLGDPRTASDAVSSIFNVETNYKRVFPENVSALQVLLPRIMFLEIHRYVTENADEFDGSWALYLKFRANYIFGRLLDRLLTDDDSRGAIIPYFDRASSLELIRSIPNWADDWLEIILPELQLNIIDRANGAGITPRQQVRRADYLDAAYKTIETSFIRELRRSNDLALRNDGQVNSIGPLSKFPVEKMKFKP